MCSSFNQAISYDIEKSQPSISKATEVELGWHAPYKLA